MSLREAAQLAVTMLKTGMPEYNTDDVLEVLEAALAQPEPEPEPLTDAQLLDILQSLDACTSHLPGGFRLFARAVEAAHGIGGPRNE